MKSFRLFQAKLVFTSSYGARAVSATGAAADLLTATTFINSSTLATRRLKPSGKTASRRPTVSGAALPIRPSHGISTVDGLKWSCPGFGVRTAAKRYF